MCSENEVPLTLSLCIFQLSFAAGNTGLNSITNNREETSAEKKTSNSESSLDLRDPNDKLGHFFQVSELLLSCNCQVLINSYQVLPSAAEGNKSSERGGEIIFFCERFTPD